MMKFFRLILLTFAAGALAPFEDRSTSGQPLERGKSIEKILNPERIIQ